MLIGMQFLNPAFSAASTPIIKHGEEVQDSKYQSYEGPITLWYILV